MIQRHVDGALAQLLRLFRPLWPILLVSTVLGIVSGIAVTALLATINTSLHVPGDRTALPVLLTFAGLCAIVVMGSILSDIGTNYVGQHVIARLREELSRKILLAPIDQIERFRTHRLIPVLTHDIDVISDFAFNLAPLAVSLSVTIGCLAYMASLSWAMLLATIVAILIGCALQFVARGRALAGFDQARELEDELQKNYRVIAEGAKELRISRPRRFAIFRTNIKGTAGRIRDIQIRSINLFVVAKVLGSSLFFIVIGIALAFQSFWPATDRAAMSGFILVLLYMKGPLEHVVGDLPIVTRAQVAFSRIAQLAHQFSSPEPHLIVEADGRQTPSMRSIELRDVLYAFPGTAESAPFVLGPIDLRIVEGETVFIVGDNGSGKTTLIKLLLGLYAPQAGMVLLNGQPVTAINRDDYRQLFTTIFSDYFLFHDLPQAGGELQADAMPYLRQLELAHKVSIEGGRFSTLDLSGGQRKRLALIQAWAERRPVLVFDEWAADQDPTFRRIFYTRLLLDLKRLGRTIIVISHDDRYFDTADRVVRLEAGRIVECEAPTPELAQEIV
ncbi:MAG: cyclic peptide export ABC transporter [Geminicoccaceae bacterium]